MNENQVIDTFNKNQFEQVITQITKFQGDKYLDVRVWYKTDDSKEEEPKPTKKGITIKLDLLPELKEAILKVEKLITGN